MGAIMAKLQGYYTVREAAAILKRSHGMVCRYIRQGLLPAQNLGNQIIIEQAAVHKFVPPPPGNPNWRRAQAVERR